jgi:hypothetical protein
MSLPVATLTYMSWLSDRKAKRADKAATNEYTRLPLRHYLLELPLIYAFEISIVS